MNVSDGDRTPVTYESDASDHERQIAEELADQGHVVIVRGTNTRGPDVIVDGVYWDIKRLTGTSARALQSSINDAKDKFTNKINEVSRNDTRAIIDVRGNSVWDDESAVRAQLDRLEANGDIDSVQEIHVITSNGIIRWPT